MAPTSNAATIRRRRNFLASLGLGAIAAFVLALVALHIASYQNVPSHMSQFANRPYGLLWVTAIYTFIVGGSMLIWALKPVLSDCPSKRAGLWMLWLAGLAAILLATFPTDQYTPVTAVGRIHNDSAVVAFALLGAAMVVLAPAFRRSPQFGRFAGVSLALGIMVTISWITYLISTLNDFAAEAPSQRVLVGLIAAWFVLLALNLRKMAPDAPTPASRAVVQAPRRRKAISAQRSGARRGSTVRGY